MLRRAGDRLKREEFALVNESDDAAGERRAKLRVDLADQEEELRGLEARWERDKSSLEGEGELRRRLDAVKIQAEKLTREGKLDEASEMLHGQIPDLERKLRESESAESAATTEKQIGRAHV